MESHQDNSSSAAVAQFKLKALIKSLQSAKGNGTSLISLIIPPKDKFTSTNVSHLSSGLGRKYVACNIFPRPRFGMHQKC